MSGAGLSGPKELCISWGTYGHHLANTIEWSMFGGVSCSCCYYCCRLLWCYWTAENSCLTYCLGWLEPLLNRIAENQSNVVAPIIDVLRDDTLRYKYTSARSASVGGFDWHLQFNWHAIPERERKRRKNEVDPAWSSFFLNFSYNLLLVTCARQLTHRTQK